MPWPQVVGQRTRRSGDAALYGAEVLAGTDGRSQSCRELGRVGEEAYDGAQADGYAEGHERKLLALIDVVDQPGKDGADDCADGYYRLLNPCDGGEVLPAKTVRAKGKEEVGRSPSHPEQDGEQENLQS